MTVSPILAVGLTVIIKQQTVIKQRQAELR